MTNAVDRNEITQLFGLADAYALLSAAFSFPGTPLAEAFVEGSFIADMAAVSADAGFETEKTAELCREIGDEVKGITADDLLKAMRVDYSALFYAPGKFRKIYPYESVFKKRLLSPNTRATAFLTKSTHEVERSMSAHGALPENARREPADFFATELDFERHLLTEYAAIVAAGEDAENCRRDAAVFFSNHIQGWIPELFAKTIEFSELPLYKSLACFGLMTLEATSAFFD